MSKESTFQKFSCISVYTEIVKLFQFSMKNQEKTLGKVIISNYKDISNNFITKFF